MVFKAISVESRWILDYLWLDPPESRTIRGIEFVTTSPVLKPDKIFGIPIFVAAARVKRLPILIWKLRRSTISFFILPLPARPDLPAYFYGTLEKQKKIVKTKRNAKEFLEASKRRRRLSSCRNNLNSSYCSTSYHTPQEITVRNVSHFNCLEVCFLERTNHLWDLTN